MVSTRFRDPQALSSALAALGTLQLRTLGGGSNFRVVRQKENKRNAHRKFFIFLMIFIMMTSPPTARKYMLEVHSREQDTERSMAVLSSIDSNAQGTPFGL
jgi:hypothetical protein